MRNGSFVRSATTGLGHWIADFAEARTDGTTGRHLDRLLGCFGANHAAFLQDHGFNSLRVSDDILCPACPVADSSVQLLDRQTAVRATGNEHVEAPSLAGRLDVACVAAGLVVPPALGRG